MKPLAVMFCSIVLGLLFISVRTAGRIDPPRTAPALPGDRTRIDKSVQRVNNRLRRYWSEHGLDPAGRADDLSLFRRLSLALHGTIPSLEEVRSFSSDPSQDRIQRWLCVMLDDQRFADYFSERLTRAFVGIEEGAFIVFRRDRLRDWFAEQIRQDRSWSQIAERLIAGDGLWTQDGHTNFITSAVVDGEGIDENKLAGRTVRVFLGQRIDCAQCHDHFFAHWKQADFEGLAAFYGQVRVTPGGVVDRRMEDGRPAIYAVTETGSDKSRVVNPQVPFHPEWQSLHGTRRQQLASWITHPGNRRFRRATVNRVWGLLFGRAWSEPVDDVPDPGGELDVLDVLAEEFAEHDDSLRFLIRVIAASEAFQLRSDVPNVSDETYTTLQEHRAVFPMVRLRPEQMIGAIFQAGNILTIDQNSHLFTRFARFRNENEFLQQYGENAEDELLRQTGSIPQALLRMNGEFTRDLTRTELLDSAGLILSYSGSDQLIVENSFLTLLTRRPTTEERHEFVTRLNSTKGFASDPQTARQHAIEDLFWELVNAREFSWNH